MAKTIAYHAAGKNIVRVAKAGRIFTATWCYLHNAGGVEFIMHEVGQPSASFGTHKGALFGLAAELANRDMHEGSKAVLAALETL